MNQEGMEILESENSALALANTIISGPNSPKEVRKATYVFVKRDDGAWLCTIDNSYGHAVIGKN